MDSSLVVLIFQIVVLIGTFIYSKVSPNPAVSSTIDEMTSRFNLIVNYADSFVAWARQFMQNSNGKEKMDEVIKRLANVAERYGIDMPEEELRAIAQKAYDSMKADQVAAEKGNTMVLQYETTPLEPLAGEFSEESEKAPTTFEA